ncbi:hypothetical protein [Hymenobacter psoromatis]|uniref:hypothetical protein n=1 Tax=Hymenobacter psoromatis TaxID=1484116 RepID=UPI001CBFF7AA|nr:hypothetical protein [Hymenobacter psoromatis]
MPQLYTASEHLEISYQPDFRVLVGRWLRPVTEAEALRDYADLLAAAHHFEARYWLLDIRRRGRSAPATLAWLLDTYYTQAVRELGAPVRLVYFMAPGLRQEFQQDGLVPEPTAYAHHESFRMNQCITEAEAMRWLVAEQGWG